MDPETKSTCFIRSDATAPALRPVYFGFDQAWLDARALNDIQYNLDILREHPDVNIVLIGNTDAIGSTARNEALSERRAEAVAAFLERSGIDEDRIVTLSGGEGYPRVATDAASRENRRVEFLIEDPSGEVSGTIDKDIDVRTLKPDDIMVERVLKPV